jgi:hypothetical protein
MALHWENVIHCKVNQTILINAFIHVKIKKNYVVQTTQSISV